MSILERVLRAFLVSCAFISILIPVVVTPLLEFPYVTGKNFLFRVLAEIMFASWLGLLTINKKYYPRRSRIISAFTLFLCIIAIADWQGVNPSKSFWGNLERMDGFITLIHLFFYIIALSSVFRDEIIWRRFFEFSLAISVGLSSFAIYETLKLGDLFIDRVSIAFGNASYVAIYMVFHVFIALLLLSRKTAWFCIPALALNLTTFVLSSTRGSFLGLVTGIMLSALCFAVFHFKFNKKHLLFGAAGVAILLSGFYGISAFMGSQLYWPIKRLFDISSNDPGILARWYNLGVAWEGIKERPWLGWGQENYDTVFNLYFDPRLVFAEPWFDRVHNHIFDWAIAGGILGLLGYLSIFAAAIVVLWSKDSFSIKERSLVTGLLAAYFIHNLAVFDTITSYLMFGIILSWLISKSIIHSEQPISIQRPYIKAISCATIATGMLCFFNLKPFLQTSTYSQAIFSTSSTERIHLLEEAFELHTLGKLEIAHFTCLTSRELIERNYRPFAIREQFEERCEKWMKSLQEQAPLNTIIPFYLGINQSMSGSGVEADVSFARALRLSPKKQIILWGIATNNEYVLGNLEKAENFLKKALALYPDFPEARTMYMAFLIRHNKDSQ